VDSAAEHRGGLSQSDKDGYRIAKSEADDDDAVNEKYVHF
jgi:hypothetical protein